MEYIINGIQARILCWTGLLWMATGLYLGYDPLTVACRAALGACLATITAGVLLRLGARIIATRLQTVLREEEGVARDGDGTAAA